MSTRAGGVGSSEPARRRLVVGVVLMAAAAVVGATAAVLAGTDDGDGGAEPPVELALDTQEGEAWSQGLFTAFKPLADHLVEVMESRRAWVAGEATPVQFATALDDKLPLFVKVRDDVMALQPVAPSEATLELYLQASRLYLEALRAYRVAVDVPDALGAELDRFGNRVRLLADRVYDRAKAASNPSRAEPADGGVEYRMVDEVPDWVAEGLAAGPPLADPPPAAAAVPPESDGTRSQQPERDWVRLVRAARIPSAETLGAAIRDSDVAALRGLAAELVAVVGHLQDEPDPSRGGRERSARLSLGLLVHGEAARAGQGAEIVGDETLSARLAGVARRLALIGDRLWDPAFGTRASGFEPALLHQTGL